jgi:phosphoribosylformylglycinamidine synthase
VLLKGCAAALAELRRRELVLAYHDRSDGGLFVTLAEMAFAARCGLDIELDPAGGAVLPQLFSEECGVVLQVAEAQLQSVRDVFAAHGLAAVVQRIGRPRPERRLRVMHAERVVLDESLNDLRRAWSETSHRMRRLRDDPECADEEFATILDDEDPGLQWRLGFSADEDVAAPYIARGVRPKVAVLREQGVNSQVEMAAALARAGFEPHDVHMSDLLAARATLGEYRGLIVCGGFSYGDVLGAGGGWAASVLFHERVRAEFERFFHRSDSFTLGVCNGCQMMARLKDLIPGATHWPRFLRNRSEQFEGRAALVEILDSPSVLLAGMAGSVLPVAVSHGEGRADFLADDLQRCIEQRLIAYRFVDNHGAVATRYPANPNGAVHGIAALTSLDGRTTIMMPHPERVFRSVQNSWHPDDAGEDSGWMRLFRNARVWVG